MPMAFRNFSKAPGRSGIQKAQQAFVGNTPPTRGPTHHERTCSGSFVCQSCPPLCSQLTLLTAATALTFLAAFIRPNTDENIGSAAGAVEAVVEFGDATLAGNNRQGFEKLATGCFRESPGKQGFAARRYPAPLGHMARAIEVDVGAN
jgi:hypothetical protein